MWCVPAFLPSWWLCLGFHPVIRTCQANCAPPRVLGPGLLKILPELFRWDKLFLPLMLCQMLFSFFLKKLVMDTKCFLHLKLVRDTKCLFYILNLWWIQSVFICSSYLSPSFIIIAFFLSSSLSFFLSTSFVGSGTSHLLMTRHLLCLFPP